MNDVLRSCDLVDLPREFINERKWSIGKSQGGYCEARHDVIFLGIIRPYVLDMVNA